MVQLPVFQLGLIVGLLLSDAFLGFSDPRSVNARINFKQSVARSSYVMFVFLAMSHYCNSVPFVVSSVRKGVKSYGLAFFTRALPCFTLLHVLFYQGNVKRVPSNIYELLTPVALAH